MKIEEAYQRQDKLEKLLYELASAPIDESAIGDIATRFKELYSDGFRHNYSRFFPLVVEIFKEDTEYNQDYLSNNLEQVRLVVEKDFFDTENKEECKYVGLYKPLMKLADHISLEIGRYSQSHIYEDKIKDIERRSQSIQEKLDKEFEKTNEKLKSAKDEIKSEIYSQLITLVGIFTAIAFLVFGGFSSLVNVFSHIGDNIAKTIMLSAIWGLIICNGVFVFLGCVEKIVQKDSKFVLPNKNKLFSWTNLILLFVFFGSLWAYIVDKYNWGIVLIEFGQNMINFIAIAGFVLITLVFAIIGVCISNHKDK